MGYNPSNYRYITNKNHSEIGLINQLSHGAPPCRSDSKRNGICSIHTWLENQHLMFLIMMFVFFNWPWRWGRWGVCLTLRHYDDVWCIYMCINYVSSFLQTGYSVEASVCRWLLSGYPHPPLQLKGWHFGFWTLLIFGYLNWQAMSNIGIQPRPGCELKPHSVAPEILPAKCTVFEQGLWSSPGSGLRREPSNRFIKRLSFTSEDGLAGWFWELQAALGEEGDGYEAATQRCGRSRNEGRQTQGRAWCRRMLAVPAIPFWRWPPDGEQINIGSWQAL